MSARQLDGLLNAEYSGIHSLFEAQVGRDPLAVAVVDGDRRLTYSTLNERANQLAHHLRTVGVGPDRLVAICLRRSAEMVVAVLAVLKAGGAYLPLDPAYPSERLNYLLTDSQPAVLLTDASGLAALDGCSLELPVLDLDTAGALWAAESSADPAPLVGSGHDLAYAIYTSGSTGQPKGVLVEHAQLLPIASAWKQGFELRPGLAHLQMASFSFDVFTADLVRSLGFGGRLVLCPRELLLDSAALFALLHKEKIAFANFVPAVLNSLISYWEATETTLPELETVVCGADIWTPDSARRLRSLCGPDVRIVNAYGVTEAAVDSTHYLLPPDGPADRPLLPAGRPLPGVALYLLDEDGQQSSAGEIWIGGAGVARGYLGRPDLTTQRFVPSPFASGERLYRTGDLGRWLPDGQLEFLGRNDSQVKIAGFRVELGEVEARLTSCPGVREAAVTARPDAAGDSRLIGYYLGEDELSGQTLWEWLTTALPEHQVPSTYVRLPAWPLTPNGKIDRAALPAPSTVTAADYLAPVDQWQNDIAALWCQLLGVSRVGLQDDFFALGGHSLLAMRLSSLIRQQLGCEVPATTVFTAPTLAEFAEHTRPDGQQTAQDMLPPIVPADRSQPLPLSFAQRRLWFLAQLEGASEAYHVPESLALNGELDELALRAALDALVARHEALRTRLVPIDGEPQQQIDPPNSGFVLYRHDLTGRADADAGLAALTRQEAIEPFDLANGPLARGRLVLLGRHRQVLLLTLHHIVADGWSMGVLLRELSVLYTAFVAGEPNPLPALPIQYPDYASWQRTWPGENVLSIQGKYWQRALDGAPALLELPADRPRPAEQDYRGGQVRVELDAELTAALTELARREHSTLFMTVLAGWATVLSRLTGQHDVVIGTPTANRRRSELEGLIGFFVNTLALRIDLDGRPSGAELLRRIREVTLSALEHQDLPFEQVVELVNPARSLSHSPLFQTLFAWQNNEEAELSLPGIEVRQESSYPVAKFDLTLSLAERDGRIVGTLDYASALFDATTAERYAGYLTRTLAELAAQPDQPVAAAGLLTEAERHWTVALCNDTDRDRIGVTVEQSFDRQVRNSPDAIAVELGAQRLSYRELADRAEQLAGRLRTLGVGPDRLVAICLERSAQLIVALLAVLKTGGGYVPLDPAYPSQRLAFMLADSAPTLLLTQTSLLAGLPDGSLPLLCLDADDSASTGGDCPLPAVAPEPDRIAYVMYTSGSTGRPKGVVQTWRGLDNLIGWQLRQAGAEPPGRVLQFASISFDVSFQEIWSTLCSGATLVLMNGTQHKELAELASFIVEQRVRRAFLPATVLQQLASLADESLAPAVAGCEIVTAGETLQAGDGLLRFVRALGGQYLYNQYGPTETHVVSQQPLACAENWPALPPIGAPIARARLYVLDSELQPVPAGVVGELYIAGAGLARGYLHQPGLTATRFLPDPFGAPGTRMYRSGDLARRLPGGELDFVGRADGQVKLRGFRVELGEIENVLRELLGVRDAAVLLREDVPGERYLAGYLVGDLSSEAAAEQLRLRLPEHMVPRRWLTLDRLPLTVNGKLDRRALPAPDRTASKLVYRAPRNENEVQLAAIWAEVLRCDRVGLDDDFFALGGHSLLATKLIHTVNQRLSARLSLRSLFQNPVLADLAAELATSTDEDSGAFVFEQLQPDPAGRYEPFPLTDIQQAYWVGRESGLELGGVGAHGYDELRLPALDLNRFSNALNLLIERHDMLRAVFHGDGSQQVLATVPRYEVATLDLRSLAPAVAEQRLAELRERMSHQLIDASRWPLFEFCVTLLDDQVRLHVSLDSLIVDAASTEILERELVRLYADPAAELAPQALTFRDYVLAEQELRTSPRYLRALDYWRQRAVELAPAPELPLICRPESIERPHFTRYQKVISADRWIELQENAKQHGVTPSVLLLTAFGQVLARWSRQPRFTLSLPLFNRLPLHPGINTVLGDFTSLLLLEVDLTGDAGIAAQARSIQDRLWHDIDHAAVSGVRVNRELSRARGTKHGAMPVVFNSTVSERDLGTSGPNLAAAFGGDTVHSITQTPQVWIDHTVYESGGELHFNWDSIDELFPPGLVAAMFGAYCELLDELATPSNWLPVVVSPLATVETPSGELPLLHELFERQARSRPDAPAVLSPDRQLNYAQLRREARTLAARLQQRGVVRGQLVPVLLRRGWQQVVGTLAVLYAGAAYLPIDPELPAQRLEHLIERSASKLVVTGSSGQWLPAGIEYLLVEPDDQTIEPAPVEQADDDLAYVIYTSGSTGTPKGVAIEHRGAVNTLLDINDRMAIGPEDRVLAVSALSFDLSVYDIFGMLAAGGAVVTLEPELAGDPAHWLELLHAHRVSVWNSVPTLLAMLVEYAADGHPLPDSLRLAMLSGDWIPLSLPGQFRSLLPSAQLHSLGGATEASIWSIHHPIGELNPGWRSIPYGKALRDQQFHVLDGRLRTRPDWVVGELYIGGAGLARGYWRDDARTADSFVQHPDTGDRLYRTGDLGRRLPDGTIEFLGREDGQVKVHGYRVELGEIEAALEGHCDIRSAALRLLGDDQDSKRLAAYVVAEAHSNLDGTALAQYLKERLPAYMVPASYTFLDMFPLSGNGKIDRAGLPEPATTVREPVAEAAPYTSTQARLVGVVEGVFGQNGIPADANLLQLGATSIDVVRIANALSKEFGFRPPLAQFMRRPTLLDLLEMFDEHTSQQATLAAAQQQGMVEDPRARQEFKALGAGRRQFSDDVPAVSLTGAAGPDRYTAYRSVRQFRSEPVSQQAIGRLLGCLAERELDGRPKYLYGSAGSSYPVQLYLYVKEDRISELGAGGYYYDPHRHRLLALGRDEQLSGDAYDYFVNRPVFEAAAFAMFLIADLAAIEPLYGEQSIGFCEIEAGSMSQLLTIEAAEVGLGVCGIGSIEDKSLDRLFGLTTTHRLLYSMLGGMPAARTARTAELEAGDDIEEIEL